jgi:hypothetical protein
MDNGKETIISTLIAKLQNICYIRVNMCSCESRQLICLLTVKVCASSVQMGVLPTYTAREKSDLSYNKCVARSGGL